MEKKVKVPCLSSFGDLEKMVNEMDLKFTRATKEFLLLDIMRRLGPAISQKIIQTSEYKPYCFSGSQQGICESVWCPPERREWLQLPLHCKLEAVPFKAHPPQGCLPPFPDFQQKNPNSRDETTAVQYSCKTKSVLRLFCPQPKLFSTVPVLHKMKSSAQFLVTHIQATILHELEIFSEPIVRPWTVLNVNMWEPRVVNQSEGVSCLVAVYQSRPLSRHCETNFTVTGHLWWQIGGCILCQVTPLTWSHRLGWVSSQCVQKVSLDPKTFHVQPKSHVHVEEKFCHFLALNQILFQSQSRQLSVIAPHKVFFSGKRPNHVFCRIVWVTSLLKMEIVWASQLACGVHELASGSLIFLIFFTF